jgi:small-conductance mechanosensitive channel
MNRRSILHIRTWLQAGAFVFLSGFALAATAANPLALPGSAPAGQDPKDAKEAAKTPAITAAELEQKRAAVQKEIAGARAELEKLPSDTQDETALRLTQEIALLERIDATLVDQQHVLQHRADLAKEAAEVDERTRDRRPPETTFKPPYGLRLLDEIYGERDYLIAAQTWLKTDVNNATTALADAREQLDDKNRARRTARESLEKSDDKSGGQGALRLSELETRLAEETVRARELGVHTLKYQQSLLQPKLALVEPRFDWLRAHLAITDQEIASLREQNEKRGAELDKAIAAAKDDAAKISRLVIAAERRADADQKGNAELESRRADRQTANLTLSILTTERSRLLELQKVIELRRKVLTGGASSKDMRDWAEVNDSAAHDLEKERRRQVTEMVKTRNELQDLEGRLARSDNGERAAAWVTDRTRRLGAYLTLNEREVSDIDTLRTARLRLKEELGQHVTTFSVHDSISEAKEDVIAAWNYEVFSVRDEPVRIKTLFAVLALIIAGYYASRWTSELVGRAIFHRLGMNTGRRAAWQTLWFYTLFIGVLLVAFNFFHMSLTQFSVVSGALAVGLGFGSQNLISNFISGIILLVERPVNQGDVIEIDGKQVTVERLGPRSTIVRSVDNTHIIVPNSRLLEQPVVNWTLSDDVLRKKIRLGVAYDSPTRKVAELLHGVLAEVEGVQKAPIPIVKFADFGENSLIFEIYFWASIYDPKDAENELRHRIAEVFAKEKIVMALPQRDVHLATTAPLQVQVMPTLGVKSDAAPPPEKL